MRRITWAARINPLGWFRRNNGRDVNGGRNSKPEYGTFRLAKIPEWTKNQNWDGLSRLNFPQVSFKGFPRKLSLGRRKDASQNQRLTHPVRPRFGKTNFRITK
jgi:hypothetical protein